MSKFKALESHTHSMLDYVRIRYTSVPFPCWKLHSLACSSRDNSSYRAFQIWINYSDVTTRHSIFWFAKGIIPK